MRHRKNFNHLGRKTGHRKAMLANMASSLILHKRIKTTTAKAKALRMYVEPLITKTKDLDSILDKTNAQRVVFSYLQDKKAVNELFVEVAPKVDNRSGGYTRIIKLGNRIGDNADMCIIELVDFNETMLAAKADTQKSAGKRKRRRGGSGSTKTEEVKSEVKVENKEEKVVEATEKEAETEQEAKVEETVEATEEKVETIEKTDEPEQVAKIEDTVEEVKEETVEPEQEAKAESNTESQEEQSEQNAEGEEESDKKEE